MKGVIFKGIRELIVTKLGSNAWQAIASSAECSESFFSSAQEYPDELALELISETARFMELSVDQVCVEFGKFWVANTGRETYPSIFALAGDRPLDFLNNINRIHKIVTRTTGSSPPSFSIEKGDEGQILIHYYSSRQLCSVLHGLILGVGQMYGQELHVTEKACVKNGADHCIMEVR